ncbi:MAG: Mammalian cell entry related domain protein [Deltaproteobacteria bacterium]|nr:Mammalian cell entry related domain protein [Deltaproteobacteria bacterium]
MAKTSNFMLGLFVTIGVLLAAAAILWWGASKYFQKGSPHVTYFDESVQGLQVDSSVKYRGVDVGRVEQIREDPDLSPKLAFTPDYPLIPSRPSQVNKILTGIDVVMEKVKDVDFQEVFRQTEKEVRDLSAQIQQTAKSMEGFFKGPASQSILKNVESATRRADEGLFRIEKILAEGNLERILARTESAATRMDRSLVRVDKVLAEANVESLRQDVQSVLQESRNVLTALKEEIRSMKLGETTLPVRELAENLDKRTRTIGNEIRILSENLRRASERFEIILENAETRPSDFIFSGPPPLRREE